MIVSQVIVGIGIALIIIYYNSTGINRADSNSYLYIKDSAFKLQNAGLTKRSIEAFEYYLELNRSLDDNSNVSIMLNLGKLYEELPDLEKALYWYYFVSSTDQKALKSKADQRIVAILNKLNKFSTAKHVLKDSTSLNKVENKKVKEGGVVVAEIDGIPIYLHQIDANIDKLPAQFRKQFSSKEGKVKFTQKFIADEILADRAIKQELDQDYKIIKDVELFKKQLLVQKVLERELKEVMSGDAKDIKNYFIANKDRYTQKKKGKKKVVAPKFEEVKDRVTLDYRMEKTQDIYQKIVTETLQTGNVKLFLERVK